MVVVHVQHTSHNYARCPCSRQAQREAPMLDAPRHASKVRIAVPDVQTVIVVNIELFPAVVSDAGHHSE
eukprot:11974822-Heterocapsa_arctica.AAC.1